MADNQNTFMDWIQLHERAWGTENYKGRPSLEDIMSAPVVAIWYPTVKGELRNIITCHQNIHEIENYLTKLIIESSRRQPAHRLTRLFVKQRAVKVKAVRFEFENLEIG